MSQRNHSAQYIAIARALRASIHTILEHNFAAAFHQLRSALIQAREPTGSCDIKARVDEALRLALVVRDVRGIQMLPPAADASTPQGLAQELDLWVQVLEACLRHRYAEPWQATVLPDRQTSSLEEEVLSCSFCGKPRSEAGNLIAGRSARICEECIDLCREILKSQDRGEDPGPNSPRSTN